MNTATPSNEPVELSKAQRRRRAKESTGQPEPKDANQIGEQPQSEQPSGLDRDVYRLASYIPELKSHFRLSEGAAIKIVDLSVSLHLTALQIAQQRNPFAGMQAGSGEENSAEEAETPQE